MIPWRSEKQPFCPEPSNVRTNCLHLKAKQGEGKKRNYSPRTCLNRCDILSWRHFYYKQKKAKENLYFPGLWSLIMISVYVKGTLSFFYFLVSEFFTRCKKELIGKLNTRKELFKIRSNIAAICWLFRNTFSVAL